jgi:hypothetical protein
MYFIIIFILTLKSVFKIDIIIDINISFCKEMINSNAIFNIQVYI